MKYKNYKEPLEYMYRRRDEIPSEYRWCYYSQERDGTTGESLKWKLKEVIAKNSVENRKVPQCYITKNEGDNFYILDDNAVVSL